MVSPSENDYEESICTLRYASRVKYIKNQIRVNVETKKGMIECFEQEIAKLQERISIISLHEEKAALKLAVINFFFLPFNNRNRPQSNRFFNIP